MTTETITLSSFLLARIAEDEAVARAASPGGWQFATVESVGGGSLYDETRMIGALHYEQPDEHDGTIVRHLLSAEANHNGTHIARHDPARVLAECAAKRRLVTGLDPSDPIDPGAATCAAWVLLALAQPYGDHPEFREEWRP